MKMTRRESLRLAGLGATIPLAGVRGALTEGAEQSYRQQRIAKLIGEYEAQGYHRTATAVDEGSGRWLADHVHNAGLAASLEPFPVNRVDLQNCACTIANRRIEGIPLFDANFTPAEGVRGRLGMAGSDAEIGLVTDQKKVNGANEGRLGAARGANRHRAIITVTRGRSSGLCPSNADKFLKPFGPLSFRYRARRENGSQTKRGSAALRMW